MFLIVHLCDVDFCDWTRIQSAPNNVSLIPNNVVLPQKLNSPLICRVLLCRLWAIDVVSIGGEEILVVSNALQTWCNEVIVVMLCRQCRIHHGLGLTYFVNPPPSSACRTSWCFLLPFHSVNYFWDIDVFTGTEHAVCHWRIVQHRFSKLLRGCPKRSACERMVFGLEPQETENWSPPDSLPAFSLSVLNITLNEHLPSRPHFPVDSPTFSAVVNSQDPGFCLHSCPFEQTLRHTYRILPPVWPCWVTWSTSECSD